LRKLGSAVSKRSIPHHRPRGPARPPARTRRTFVATHAAQLRVAALPTVRPLTVRTLYVMVFITHGRRELAHVDVTPQPTAAWVWRRVIEATPWGRRPRYLLRDRDHVYGGAFRERARRLGIETLLTPVRAPRANAIAERVLGSLRRGCLEHLIIANEQHRRSVLAEFVRYHDTERPHRTLRRDTPLPHARSSIGPIRSRPVLGGLRHVYDRAA
jgi:putative transposase